MSTLDAIHPVSRETNHALEVYVDLLLKWQKRINLIGPSTKEDIWTRHIADSLACFALKPDAKKWIDLGSGAGLPGLVIAAALINDAAAETILIESNQKKTSFLRQASRQMGVATQVLADRIEAVAEEMPAPDIITARALASLDDLLTMTEHWLKNGAVGLFHKGREYRSEIEKCDGLWRYNLVVHNNDLSAGSVILEISELKRISG